MLETIWVPECQKNAKTSLFKRYYSQACALAALIDIQPTIPRVASWQIFRANAESNTPLKYYLINVCYPLIDHLMQGIDHRFAKYGIIVYLMYGLIPSVIVERDITVKHIIEQYQDDLPMPINAEEEFFRWQKRWETVSKSDRPSTIASSESVRPWGVSKLPHVTKHLC